MNGTAGLASVVLGSMMKDLRTSKDPKVTQAMVADQVGVTTSAYFKWESGLRRITPEHLERICESLNCKDWRRRSMMSLLSGTMSDFRLGQQPRISSEDVEFIESLSFPALYRSLPDFDIIYSNQACISAFPMFTPAPLNEAHRANLIERMITDPRSPRVFVNWSQVAHRMVYLKRLWSSGTSAAHHERIMRACRSEAAFEYMWRTIPGPDVHGNNRIAVRDPVTGEVRNRTVRCLISNSRTGSADIIAAPTVRSTEALEPSSIGS
ncbi:helix-turn-helix transcriptional regulator (plasmid) [Nocardia sp. NBC_01377]|uniref:helix-turn-helix domain-containing protein n=1 Tax=Nocardia sp. NBC_01377 TaxID=2903595 RepID=UPI002F90CABA